MADEVGLLEALLDAIHGEDEVIGGRAFTKLVSPLSETETKKGQPPAIYVEHII